ncbi:hypothetical protein B0I37DRAFT_352020 [Chaetomium sp. MPI-CAGE-AT-0009]|nr:hypothetical protein B0I37DRAFT_352020 [Chaetomium sp. MPI-CAGE-AT-0009]
MCIRQHDIRPVIVRRLSAAGLEWMMGTDVVWDDSGRRLKNPANLDGPWIALAAPDMPEHFRQHNPERFRRERPVYTVHADHTITVSQPSILLGNYTATRQEMQACDDRIEQLADGTIRYTGPLRPLRRVQGQLEANQNNNAEVEVGRGQQARPPQEQEAYPPGEQQARYPQKKQTFEGVGQTVIHTINNRTPSKGFALWKASFWEIAKRRIASQSWGESV